MFSRSTHVGGLGFARWPSLSGDLGDTQPGPVQDLMCVWDPVVLKPCIGLGLLRIGTDHLGRWLTALLSHLGDGPPQLRHTFAGVSGKSVKETSFVTRLVCLLGFSGSVTK